MRSATWWGEPVLGVTGDGWTARVSPRRGGKIVSLRADGVEWLAQPLLPLPPPAEPGAGFTDAEMCGWDECAPSIVACTVAGRELPDHGELWTQRWRVEGEWLTASGPSFGYRLARRLEARGRRLRIEYVLQAGDADVPFLWAAHPQLVAPRGSEVRLETAAGRVFDVMVEPAVPVPLEPGLCRVDTLEPGGCRKFYLGPEDRAAAAHLVRRGGRSLTMTWDPTVTPYLGVWLDRCAYSREPVVAIEPSTGYYDSLAPALERALVPVVAAGSTLSWWCELSFGRAAG